MHGYSLLESRLRKDKFSILCKPKPNLYDEISINDTSKHACYLTPILAITVSANLKLSYKLLLNHCIPITFKK